MVEWILGNLVEMIESSLSCPANEHGRLNVGACPIKDIGKFLPIGDLLKVKLFDWGTRDNHSIKLLVTKLTERRVETLHMLGRCIFRHVG